MAVPLPVFDVQLASVRGESAARAEWARLVRRHQALLGELKLTVMRTELSATSVFHRVLAGPLRDRAAARQLCQDLAKRKVGCLIVQRPDKTGG